MKKKYYIIDMLGRKREVTETFAKTIVNFPNSNTRVLDMPGPQLKSFDKNPSGFLTKIKDLKTRGVAEDRISNVFKRNELLQAYKELGMSEGKEKTKAVLIKHIIENL